MKKLLFAIINYSLLIIHSENTDAQLLWVNADSLYQPLPSSIHIYKTTDSIDGKPNIAFYVIADLMDKRILFDADTTLHRRMTPKQFYEKNEQPLVVVNTTFFSFQTNQNLNLVIKDGRLVGYNIHSLPGRGRDTLSYWHPLGSAIGINKKRMADVAWLYTDSVLRYPVAFERSPQLIKNAYPTISKFEYAPELRHNPKSEKRKGIIDKWKMHTAIGGGPVLLQNGQIKITNNEERKFAGNAINDKHPRTAMGYTKDNKLIILVVQGRSPGIAEGATLVQEAKILQDLGCWEALNLDGGGSSCLLVNGKETIKPSDATGQRPVPAVFMIKKK